MYHVTSWYDIFLHGGLTNFAGLRQRAATEAARRGQKLLIGPWAHLFPYTSPTSTGTGDIDFGPQALIDLHDVQLRWFDHFLKGIDTGILDEPPVKLFVMGENRWRDEAEWPLGRTRYTPWYLHSGGGANTAAGDGVLAATAPADEPADHFTYDPGDPVPTRGGNTLILAMGVADQRAVESRADVLVYTSAPMTAPLEVTGPVVVTLHAASSAPDTDFTAKLVDVHPDGHARNLCDGIVRARYRESRTTPRPLHPGEVTKLHDRPVGDEPRVPAGASPAARRLLQQLPALRPEPEHGRGPGDGDALADRAADGLSRPPLPVPRLAARDSALRLRLPYHA